MKKSILFCFLLLGLISRLKAQELSYFIKLAVKDNQNILAKTAEIAALKTQEDQFSAWQDPVLSAGYNVLPGGMERGHLSLMQNFKWFGTTQHQKAAARQAVHSEAQRLQALKKQIIVNLSLLYLEIQKAEQLMEVKKKGLKNLNYLEELAQNRIATSNGTMVDVIRAQLASEQAALEIDNLKKKRKALSFSFNKLIDRKEEESITIVPLTTEWNKEQPTLTQHPEIAAIEYQIKQNKEETIVVQKNALPDFSVGLEYMRMKPDGNELMPMIGISLPVFKKKYKARIAETEKMQVVYKRKKTAKINQMESEVNLLQSQIQQTENELNLTENQLKKIKEAERLLLTYYSTSGEDFKDIIEMKQKELSYQTSIIDAKIKLLQLRQQIKYYY